MFVSRYYPTNDPHFSKYSARDAVKFFLGFDLDNEDMPEEEKHNRTICRMAYHLCPVVLAHRGNAHTAALHDKLQCFVLMENILNSIREFCNVDTGFKRVRILKTILEHFRRWFDNLYPATAPLEPMTSIIMHCAVKTVLRFLHIYNDLSKDSGLFQRVCAELFATQHTEIFVIVDSFVHLSDEQYIQPAIVEYNAHANRFDCLFPDIVHGYVSLRCTASVGHDKMLGSGELGDCSAWLRDYSAYLTMEIEHYANFAKMDLAVSVEEHVTVPVTYMKTTYLSALERVEELVTEPRPHVVTHLKTVCVPIMHSNVFQILDKCVCDGMQCADMEDAKNSVISALNFYDAVDKGISKPNKPAPWTYVLKLNFFPECRDEPKFSREVMGGDYDYYSPQTKKHVQAIVDCLFESVRGSLEDININFGMAFSLESNPLMTVYHLLCNEVAAKHRAYNAKTALITISKMLKDIVVGTCLFDQINFSGCGEFKQACHALTDVNTKPDMKALIDKLPVQTDLMPTFLKLNACDMALFREFEWVFTDGTAVDLKAVRDRIGAMFITLFVEGRDRIAKNIAGGSGDVRVNAVDLERNYEITRCEVQREIGNVLGLLKAKYTTILHFLGVFQQDAARFHFEVASHALVVGNNPEAHNMVQHARTDCLLSELAFSMHPQQHARLLREIARDALIVRGDDEVLPCRMVWLPSFVL